MNKDKKIIILSVIFAILCSLVSAEEIGELTNVALGKKAVSSSVYDETTLAELACDGINDNKDYTKWKSADEDKQPWIKIDLAIAYKITKIELEASKGDTDIRERKGFKISASNDEGFKEETELYQSKDKTIEKDKSLIIDISKRTPFRYIKISKTEEGPLSFGEIKIFADTASLANIIGSDDVTSIAASFTDEGRYIIPSDASNAGIGNELGLLAALKIMQSYPDGNFYPYNNISRAEFAAVAVRLINMQGIIEYNSGFSDVTEEHWAYKYVIAAKNLGLINGISNDVYMPDENITYEQMEKVLVCALGYEIEAENLGGYPIGYAMIASRLKLSKGVAKEEEYVTRRDAALMLYNALMAKPFLQNTINEYKKAQENLLEYVFGVTYFDGTVDGVNGTSLTDNNIKLSSKRVSINGIVYDTIFPYFEKFFSMKVRCFKDDDNIIYAYANKDNETLTIEKHDFKGYENDTILYYINDKLKTAKIKSDIDVIYNGKALRSYNYDSIFDNFDRLIFTNNDADDFYDVLRIEYEKIGVVAWVDKKEQRIYFKNTAEYFDYGENIMKAVLISSADTSEILPEQLNEYDVLNVLESMDDTGERLATVYVTSNEIYGAATDVNEDNVVIKNKMYKIWEGFDMSKIKLGERISYYTDRHLRIVYSDSDASSKNMYGFLKNVYYDNFEEEASVKIYASNGKFMTYKLKKSIILDGNKTSVNANIEKNLGNTAKFDKYGQAIRYALNDEGKIKLLDTLKNVAENDDDTFRCNVNMGDKSDSIYYSSTGIFDARYVLSDSAVIMRIPEVIDNEKEYEIESAAKYKNGYNYSFWGYGDDKDTLEFIISQDGAKVDKNSNLFIISKIYNIYGDDGEAKKKLYGYYKGAMTEFEEYDAGMAEKAGAKAGDIFRISTDEKNRIRGMVKSFYIGDLPQDASYAISTNSPVLGVAGEIYNIYQDFFIAYATVMTRKDGNMLLKIYNADGSVNSEAKNNSEILIKVPENKIGVYDSSATTTSERVYAGDSSEIIDADTIGDKDKASKVLIKAKNGSISDIILLK